MKKTSLIILIAIGATSCLKVNVKQNAATDRYPVSASSALYDEKGNVVYGPGQDNLDQVQYISGGAPFLGREERNARLKSMVGKKEGVNQGLVVIKNVRVTQTVWHWSFFTFNEELDYRDSINSEIEAAGGEGMINFRFITVSGGGSTLSCITYQLLPGYTEVGYEADIVRRK